MDGIHCASLISLISGHGNPNPDNTKIAGLFEMTRWCVPVMHHHCLPSEVSCVTQPSIGYVFCLRFLQNYDQKTSHFNNDGYTISLT